jgi:hypothetical protein
MAYSVTQRAHEIESEWRLVRRGARWIGRGQGMVLSAVGLGLGVAGPCGDSPDGKAVVWCRCHGPNDVRGDRTGAWVGCVGCVLLAGEAGNEGGSMIALRYE